MCLALIMSGCSNPPASTTQSTSSNAGTIKIGLILDLSGPFASMSAFEKPGVEMVIDQFNQAGGIMGRQLELLVRDDQLDPTICLQKADELKSAGVVGIIGAAADNDNAALSGWAKTNHIPIAAGTSAELSLRSTNFSGYNFFCTPTGWTYGRILADWAIKKNFKSVYAIATDVGANHATYDSFAEAIKGSSIVNLGNVYTSMTESDFSSAITTGLAKKPELLLDLCAGPSGPSFIKQAQQFNTFNVTTVAGTYLLEAAITSAFPDKSYPVGLVATDNCPFWLNTPEMKAFSTAYYKKTNSYPSNATIAFYLSALSLCTAIQTANSTDPDKIVKAWEGMTVTNSPVGSFSFHAYDHQAEVPVYLNTSGYVSDFPIAVGIDPIKYQQGYYPDQNMINSLRAAK